MARKQEQTDELNDLVLSAGGTRKAAAIILSVKGYAPSHSTIHKAISTTTTKAPNTNPYYIQCYIDDLKQGLKSRDIAQALEEKEKKDEQ